MTPAYKCVVESILKSGQDTGEAIPRHLMVVKVKIKWLITDVLVRVTVQTTVLIKCVVLTGSYTMEIVNSIII